MSAWNRFWIWLYDESGKRTITIPADGIANMSSSQIRTELQTLEDETAHTSTGHRHDGTDSKLLDNATPTTMAIGDSSSGGSGSSYSRSDHKQGSPSAGTPITQALGDTATEGAATTFARSNHRHGMPAQPSGEDLLSGTIILWDGSGCPSGYTRVSALDGKFLVSSSSYNASAGGADSVAPTGSTDSAGSHTHSVTSHGHSLNSGATDLGITAFEVGTDNSAGTMLVQSTSNTIASTMRKSDTTSTSGTIDSSGSHTHTATANSIDTRPSYATIILCKKN